MPSKEQHDGQALEVLGFALPEFRRLVIDDEAARRRLNHRHRIYGHDEATLTLAATLYGERGRLYFTLHFLQDAGLIGSSIYPKEPREYCLSDR